MSRKFISLVVATSMAITGFTALPARAADPDDVARILGAAATLFIIGKAIQMNQDDDKEKKKDKKPTVHITPPSSAYSHRPGSVHHGHPGRFFDKAKPGHHNAPPVVIGRTFPPRAKPAPLPRACVLDVRQGRSTFRVLGQRCLERTYRSARPLPSSCKIDVRGRHGVNAAYVESCLRRNGYEIASR